MSEERAEPVEPLSPRDDADAASRIGTVVDKYTVVRLLGRGGMGAVYATPAGIILKILP